MIELGPWTPDLPVQGSSVYVAKNVLPGRGEYSPFPDFAVNTSALTGPCKGAIAVEANTGTNYLYAGDATNLYRLVDDVWTSAQSGLASDNFVEFAKWGEDIIAVNGYTDAPQVITMGGTSFSALSGSPPKAKHVATVRDFVMMGNINGAPNKVQWSSINNSESWTGDQSDSQEFPDGGNVQRIIGGEYGIVFQEQSIRRMTYVGSPLVFQVDEIEPGRGTLAPGSVVQYGNMIFYYGLDGFYAFNGQQSIPIGFGKIDEWFVENSQADLLPFMTGAFDPVKGRVRWSFARAGSTENDCVIVYDIRAQQWTYAEIGVQILYQSRTSSLTLEGLDDFYTSIDDIPGSLDDSIFQGGTIFMAGFDQDNKHGYFTGLPLDGEIQTGEVRLAGSRNSRVNAVEPIIEGSCSVRLGYRQNKQDDVTWTSSVATNSYGVCDFNVEARYHRAKILPTGSWDKLQGLEIEAHSRGRK